ncbi:MAG: ankyrin repeat domain-containing protein [Elusimicrobia bacterium]|nr:ankyrin repeat domain-containing protein [Elusimicrobiota bacterium]
MMRLAGIAVAVSLILGCASVKEAVEDAMTPSVRQFISAAREGRLDSVKDWLDKGVDINSQPGDLLSRTALMVAAARKQAETVDYLLSRGADPKLADNGGRTALHFAAEAGAPAIIRQLAFKGADVDAKDGEGRTPMIAAAEKGNAEAVQALLDAHASAVLPGPDGETPLHAAVTEGSLAAARALLLQGADKNLKNAFGESPLDIAARRDARPMLALLALDKAGLRAWRPAPSAAPDAAAALPGVETPPKARRPRPDDYALIIGIQDYQSVPKADYGVRDAQTVRRYVEALGVPARNVVSLTGSAATGSKLKSYLEEWLPLNVKKDSTLFVYYSGHGAPDPATGEAYLVPWDGDPQFLKSTAYPLKTFYSDLAKTKAKNVIVALDACFSGAGGRSVLPRGARPLVTKTADEEPAGGNITVLAAASGEEITGTLDSVRHGLFTYYLLRGLSGGAREADGKMTAKSLYEYVKPQVSDEARRQNRSQTPVFIGEDATL